MKITIKLFGTLSQRFPDYNPDQGLELEIPDESKVEDLLALLGISGSHGELVVRNGHLLLKKEKLKGGSMIQVFQAMLGG